MNSLVIPLQDLRMNDVDRVGGKNASLGELIGNLAEAGVRVPGGFATTADAFRAFVAQPYNDSNTLRRAQGGRASVLDVDDVERLAIVGARIRGLVVDMPFPPQLEAGIRAALDRLPERRQGRQLRGAVERDRRGLALASNALRLKEGA
jgi:pyruvate,water dikinase